MNFSISFLESSRPRLHSYWDKILQSNKWTDNDYFVQKFEDMFSQYIGLYSVAFATWSDGAESCVQFYNDVYYYFGVCNNTFIGTASCNGSGKEPVLIDCNKSDLCLSYDSLVKEYANKRFDALWITHIGGHIAFEIDKIVKFCKENRIVLFEDCAHSVGAEWNGKKAGSFGEFGVYSFHATKTLSTGEGCMVVTKKDLADYLKSCRKYGGHGSYNTYARNRTMNEFTAAIGCVAMEDLDIILDKRREIAAKYDQIYKDRIYLPKGMTSGYYKYIVFEQIEKSVGKVYETLVSEICNQVVDTPNAKWVSRNHWCVPLFI